MFIENLNELEKKYANILKEIENYLYSVPRGHIKTFQRGESFSYYLCEDGETNGIYLQRNNPDGVKKIEQYCQKKYCKMLLPVVSKDLELIQYVKRKMDSRNMSDVFEELPKAIKQYVIPFELSNEEYTKRWKDAPYKKSTLPIENQGYVTKKGEKVRSKSELIIADRLYDSDIPYKYEKVYRFSEYGEFAPDFTVLNKRTRQVYIWEHFGLMGNTEYRAKALRKIEMYQKIESYSDIKFISTFEEENVNLSISTLNAVIKNNFL